MKYKTILLKLSGEALAGSAGHGFDVDILQQYIADIKEVYELGCNIAIVVGGGNIFRGLQGQAKGFDRVQGDYMGMMATIINSMAIQGELEAQGVPAMILSSIEIPLFAKPMSRKRVLMNFKKRRVVIIGAGTGNPFFTTDSASALRAIEANADILLKGTRVDGVYDCDPEKNPNAKKYDQLTFDEAYQKNLKIMDLTAFTLCKENNMPICVFDMNKKGNILKVVNGEAVGTLITV
jgi:uridylate kinase